MKVAESRNVDVDVRHAIQGNFYLPAIFEKNS
jgi:hypothetical protein